MPARVWIAGEGNNDLGGDDGRGVRSGGVLEALLVRMCDGGWRCAGRLEWRTIQKFQAGGAHLSRSSHGDYRNVLGLVLAAYEDAADAVAFSRDVDGEPEREDAVATALAWIRDESGWLIRVVGGVAKPALEGWILARKAVPGTDAMSRARAADHLAQHRIDLKSTEAYVDVVERVELGDPPHFGLPAGSESLRAWLATAHEVLNRLVRGYPAR